MQRLTREQAAVISAYTGFLAGPFSDFHLYAEKILGRSVWTHEMGRPEVMAQIQEAAKPDFLSLCAAP